MPLSLLVKIPELPQQHRHARFFLVPMLRFFKHPRAKQMLYSLDQINTWARQDEEELDPSAW